MTKKQAAAILADFNKWRRGESPYTSMIPVFEHSPKDIGLAIDIAISVLKKPSAS